MDLYNSTLSMTYHDQHIAMATKVGDAKMLFEAHQLQGDSYMKMECLEDAVQSYMTMFQVAHLN